MKNKKTTTLKNRNVLILNKSWLPVGVISLRNAFCKLFSERARAINHYNYNLYDFNEWITIRDIRLKYIIGCSVEVPVPEIIVSTFYDSVPSFAARVSRRNILKRDKYTCQYSGRKLSLKEATIDHIVPRSKGGQDSWFNCVASSFKINNKKSNSPLEDTNLSLIKKPTKPKDDFMFKISDFHLPESWRHYFIKKGRHL
tara:strand:+ start:363 stop:959 length:597 start_codon:yes stop_codon:yes gene_type:complete